MTGIGEPYHVYLETDVSDELTSIRPRPISFTVLEGKHAEGTERKGRLLAVSEDEAILETDAELSLYDNLLMTVQDGLYAKVVELDRAGFHIRFTAKPSAFQGWLDDIRKAPDVGEKKEEQP